MTPTPTIIIPTHIPVPTLIPIKWPTNLPELKTWSEIFQSVGVGIGAILGGAGGIVYIMDWLGKKQKAYQVMQLRKKYPNDSLNREFRIVDIPEHPGRLWILDNRSDKERRWIKNLPTLYDLGFDFADKVQVTKEEFDGFPRKEAIDTQ